MMGVIYAFVAGVIVGGFGGVLLAGMCAAAKKVSDDLAKYDVSDIESEEENADRVTSIEDILRGKSLM